MRIKSESNFPETLDGKPTFLLEGISLSDDDKLKNFDELKRLCEEMEKKAVCYKQRCDYIQSQVKLSEQSKAKTKKKKPAKGKVYSPKFDSDLFELIEDDETIPNGWKSAWRILDGFSKGGRVKVFWEPNGKYCPSRVNAISQMISSFGSSQEDLDIMKKTLYEEGWKPNPSLPPGWMFNKSSSKETKVFVDSKFRYFKNIKTAVKELCSEYSDEELKTFLVTYVLNSVKDREESTEEDIELKKDEKIPASWKVGHIRNRNFKSSLFVITGEGQTLLTSSKVKEVITNSTDLSDEEKEPFINYLARLRNRGFKDNAMKEETTARRNPVSAPDPAKQPAPVVKTVVKNKGSPLTWLTDNSIPSAWKTAVVTDEQFGTKKYFMDPSGSTFHGRLEALRAMVRSPHIYPQSDFSVMKRGLAVDGWHESDACPADWLRKKKNIKNEKKESFTYLSDNFVVLDTFEKVINYMTNGGFSEDVINNFKSKNGLNWHTDPLLPPGWTYANHKTEKQGVIKRLLDPFGKICFSSAHAIRTVFETSGDCRELRCLREYMLQSDGWFETKYLPPGWMIKQKRSETGFYILNEKYEKFNTMIALKSYLLNSKHGQEAVEKFENNYKELQQPVMYCKSKQSKYKSMTKNKTSENLNLGKQETQQQSIKQPHQQLQPEPQPKPKQVQRKDVKSPDIVEGEEDDDEEDLVLSDTELEEMNLDTSFSSNAGRGHSVDSVEGLDDLDDMEVDDDSDSEIAELVWETDPSLPSGWTVNIFELTFGEMRGIKLKRYRSPCDNYFGNLPEVLKFMENSIYTEMDKSIFRNLLNDDGWEKIESISENWFFKYIKGKFKY